MTASNLAELVDHIDHFQHRSLQDALADATSAFWHRRAQEFEAAKPRPGDFPGLSTLDERRAAWRRCDQAAKACRARAAVSLRELVA